MTRLKRAAVGLAAAAAITLAPLGMGTPSAEVSGHFTSGASKTRLHVKEQTGTPHAVIFQAGSELISCHKVQYWPHHLSITTFQQVTVTPIYESCTVSLNGATTNASVKMNGCHYLFWARSTGHATVELICPAGSKVEVQGLFCTFRLGPQKPWGGVSYTNVTVEGKTAVTVDVTLEKITYEQHGPMCGTTTTLVAGRMLGSVLVQGTNTDTGQLVDVTAT
jgi:hypothetical protein